MFSKSFDEMLQVDVASYIRKRDDSDNAEYLPWAACKKLLHDNGAEEVMFWPVPGPDGSTLRKSDVAFADKNGVLNRCYEVLVHIKVDSLEWDVVYPVLNGNIPVRDNSMNQLRVHNAIRRAFVKGVAERTGLGFNLWLNVEDLPDEVDDLGKHSILKCRQRLLELVTDKINQGIPLNVMADRLGRTEDELRAMMNWHLTLAKLEKSIWEMNP